MEIKASSGGGGGSSKLIITDRLVKPAGFEVFSMSGLNIVEHKLLCFFSDKICLVGYM